MAIIYNRRTTGLYTNGAAQLQSNENFTGYNYTTSDSLSGNGCFIMDFNVAGSTFTASEYIPVDTSKNYQFAVSAKGVSQGNLGFEPGGHLGFACYNENFSFLGLRSQKGIGNTTLTRPTLENDTSIYIADGSAWYKGTTSSFAWVNFYTSTSEFNIGYSTLSSRAYQLTGTAVTDIGGGEWRVDLTAGLPASYAFPAGTNVSNGQDGGSYNYCHGAPNHTVASGWQTYVTPVFTGENRNSTYPFRYGTKYVRFLNLRNYNSRNSGETTRPVYLIDNIMVVERPNGIALPTSFFSSNRIK